MSALTVSPWQFWRKQVEGCTQRRKRASTGLTCRRRELRMRSKEADQDLIGLISVEVGRAQIIQNCLGLVPAQRLAFGSIHDVGHNVGLGSGLILSLPQQSWPNVSRNGSATFSQFFLRPISPIRSVTAWLVVLTQKDPDVCLAQQMWFWYVSSVRKTEHANRSMWHARENWTLQECQGKAANGKK